MNRFYIEIKNNEYRLYNLDGTVFFILKERNDKYLRYIDDSYTAHLDMYEPIVDQLKNWLLETIKTNSKEGLEEIQFNHDKITKPMFREQKLKELGI